MLTLESSDAEVLEEMEKLRVLYKLKTTMRYQTSRIEGHSESVAEHLFAMQVLAQYFLPLEDPAGKLDRERVTELMLFHELGEIETGDILFHRKNDEQRQEEALAAGRVAKKLPESLQKIALDRSREFDNEATPEATFAVAIDKLEPIFELFDERELPAFRRLHVTHKDAVSNKRIAAKNFPYMLKCLDAWERRAVSLDIFPQ